MGLSGRTGDKLLGLVAPSPFADDQLAPLDYTRRYFDEIAAYYGDPEDNRILVGDAAQASALQQYGADFGVIYLATHAKASTDDPLDSFIALARTEAHDGLLRMPDIFSMTLRAHLVILGACETGLGVVSSDGVNGFSRAFLWAGSSSLLMTLWPVGEEQSLNQMYAFHEAWRSRSVGKAAALREAQLDARKNYPDQPNVWASYVLYGDWG